MLSVCILDRYPRSQVDRITVSAPNEQNRLGRSEVHHGSEGRRDPPKHAEGRTLPEPEEDDWRNIAITLIIRTYRCELNRKESEFEC